MKSVTRREIMHQAAAAGLTTLAVSAALPAASAQDRPRVNVETPVSSKATAEDHGPRELFAVVDAEGTLRRGLHASNVRNLGPGLFEVTFRRDVRRGAYLATLGGHGYEGLPPMGHISVMGRSSNPRAVLVSMVDIQGNPLNMGFHLLVICPDGYA